METTTNTIEITDFNQFKLNDKLNAALKAMHYKEPTPIQAKAIPLALMGKDILGSAQTGTGKTAAFSIPLVQNILSNPHGTALVMTPTRELAKQVLDVIHQLLGAQSGVKTAFIIGGESMAKQFNQLKARPRIIVGTPGRINDHLTRGTLKLKDTGFLVLDETDRMLDMGFGIQIDKIVKEMPQKRQTLLFSATLPQGIIQMSSKYLYQPERVSMGNTNVVAPKIKQETVRVNHPEKYEMLKNELAEREGSVIVFIKTKHAADKIAKNLNRDGVRADALHGDLKQNKRTRVMKGFQDMQFRVLVATDIAARGLDVPHIEHVINFDLPQVAEDYIHRMGRTARAGATGSAISFIAPHDSRMWSEIERLLDPSKKSNDNAGKTSRKAHKGKKPFADKGKPLSKKKAFGDKAPFGEKKSYGAKKFGDKKPYSGKPSFAGKKPYGEKSNDDSSEKKAYGEKRSFEGKKTFGDKKPYGDRNSETSGEKKSFEGKKSFGEKKSYGDKPAFGEKKPYGEKKPFRGGKPSGKPSNGKSYGKPTTGGKKPFRSSGKPRPNNQTAA